MYTVDKLRIKIIMADLAKYLLVHLNPRRPTSIYDIELCGFGVYRVTELPGHYFMHCRVNGISIKRLLLSK